MLSALRNSALGSLRQRVVPTVSSTLNSVLGWDAGVGMTSLWDSTQVRWRSGRSRRGLYDGKDIRTGNNVSFSMRATKRKFKPNVFKKRLYSETLDDMIRFHVTAAALRSIDKAGGLDNYLLCPKRNITEGEGYVIKKKILKKRKNQAWFARKEAEKAQASGGGNSEDAGAEAS